MGINIWLPIVVNVLIGLIMVAGVLIGRKNGFKIELLKLLITCGVAVGLYFVSPYIVSLLLSIEALAELVVHGVISIEIIKSVVLFLLFIIEYLIVCGIFAGIRKHNAKKHMPVSLAAGNTARRAKVHGATKAETRELKRQQREFDKKHRKEAKKQMIKAGKVSRVFGAIIGFIFAIVVAFVITLPLKPIFAKVAQLKPEVEQITKGYEYTPYGQLDNATSIVDTLLK